MQLSREVTGSREATFWRSRELRAFPLGARHKAIRDEKRKEPHAFLQPRDPEWLAGDETINRDLSSGGGRLEVCLRPRDHAHLIRKSMPKLDGACSTRTPLVTLRCSPGVESESRAAQSVSAPRGCSTVAARRLRGCPRLRILSTVGPAKGRCCRKTRDAFHPWRPRPLGAGSMMIGGLPMGDQR